MSDTIRERIIKENLAKIAENVRKLNDWERDFYRNVKNLNPELFTPKQFNRIKELAEKD